MREICARFASNTPRTSSSWTVDESTSLESVKILVAEDVRVTPADNELSLESSPAAMRLGVDALTRVPAAAAAAAALAALSALSAFAAAFELFAASI